MKRTSLFLIIVTMLALVLTCGCGNINEEKVTADNVAEMSRKVSRSDLSPADKDLFEQRIKYDFEDGSTVSFLINEQRELNEKLNTPLPQLPSKELNTYIKDLNLTKEQETKVFRMKNLNYRVIGKSVNQLIAEHDEITKAFFGVQLSDDYKLSYKKYDAITNKHYKSYQSIYEGSIVNNSGRDIKEVGLWFIFRNDGTRSGIQLTGKTIPNGGRWKFAVDVHSDEPVEEFVLQGINFVRFSDGTSWNLPRLFNDEDRKEQPYNGKPINLQFPPDVDSFSILNTGKINHNKASK